MDQRAALQAAVLGGAQIGAPTSPLGSFPELQGLYNVDFAHQAVAPAAKASAYNTGVTVDNQKAAEAEAKANEIDRLKAKAQAIQDASDPSKYQVQQKDDGGFAFFDPSGREISAWDYSRATGQKPDAVLEQSQNPIDIGFRQDYKQLNDYINAKIQSKNDPDGAGQTAKQIEEIVKKNYGVDLHKMKVQDVIKRFQQAYPTVFGGNKKGVPTGQTFIPSTKAMSSGGGIGG